MTAMTTQPTSDTTIFSEFDAKYCYVATVQTPEFVAGAAVTYTEHTYNPVTRGGYTADLLGVAAKPRVSIPSAVSPGSSFVLLVMFYNEADTTEGFVAAGKTHWNNANGFYIASKTNINTLEINGGGSGYPTISAPNIGAIGTLHVLAVEFSGTIANLSLNGATLGTVTGLEAAGAWPSGIAFGNYAGTADGTTTSRSIIMGAVLGSKGSKTLNQLTANPWLIFDDGASSGASAQITATADDTTASFNASVSPLAQIAATTADATFSGGASTGSASAQISATTDDAVFSGTATGDTSSGTITTPALKNNTGTVLASLSGWTVNVYNASTGALVVQKTGLSTNAFGVLTITDALIVAGTSYTYEPVHVTYGRRLPLAAAA